MINSYTSQYSFAGGGICAAVAAHDTQQAVTSVQPFIELVDVVEIRLDAMHDPYLPDLRQGIPLPLLLTNRPTWEGGAFRGSEEDRLECLQDALQYEPAYIDLELQTQKVLRNLLLDSIKDTRTRMILSYHNFALTPDWATLSEILGNLVESGAHIGKIVTRAHDHLDVLRVLRLLEEAGRHGFPLIAFCMGQAGRLSRIITLLLGGFMTYAALDKDRATAPGQLTVEELRTALACLAGY